MRSSGWILFGAAGAIFIATIILPLLGAVDAFFFGHSSGQEATDTGSLLWRTARWALAATLGALIIGWWPGRLLAIRLNRRGFVPLAVVCVLPICLPPYAHFWIWRLTWPTDSALFRWAVEHNQMDAVRSATLFIALVSWAWPIAAWSIAGSLSTHSRDEEDMLLLDGAGPIAQALSRLRAAAPGIVIGTIVIFLFVFNNTTAFDLAQVRTLGYELRSLEGVGATPRDILISGWPGMVMSIVCLLLAIPVLRKRPRSADERPPRSSRLSLFMTLAILTVTIGPPVILIFSHGIDPAMIETVRLGYAEAAVNSAAIALIAGAIAAATCAGFAAAWMDRRKWVRAAASGQAAGWIIAAIVPAFVIVAALIATFNRPGLDVIYDSPAVTVLGHLARFGFVAVLFGAWIAAHEAAELRWLRELDGAGTLRGLWATTWPRFLAAGVATWAVVAVLSLGEVVVAGRLQSPGFETIAHIFLDNMHYQRNEMVLLMTALLLLLALAVSIVVVLASRVAAARRIADG